MAYNEFTLDEMIRLFGLRVVSQPDAFVEAASVTLSTLLRETLAESVTLALGVSTEKARSEFIIAPVLAEVRRQMGGQISLFSGIDFTVDAEVGLRGVCDFFRTYAVASSVMVGCLRYRRIASRMRSVLAA